VQRDLKDFRPLVIALNAGGPGPTREYANAAVDIRRAAGTYTGDPAPNPNDHNRAG
jgi:hypothetical protein